MKKILLLVIVLSLIFQVGCHNSQSNTGATYTTNIQEPINNEGVDIYVTEAETLSIVLDSFGEKSVEEDVVKSASRSVFATNLYLRDILLSINESTVVDYYSDDEFDLNFEQAKWMVDIAVLYSQMDKSGKLKDDNDEYVTQKEATEVIKKNYPYEELSLAEKPTDDIADLSFVNTLLFDVGAELFPWEMFLHSKEISEKVTERELQFMIDYANLKSVSPF